MNFNPEHFTPEEIDLLLAVINMSDDAEHPVAHFGNISYFKFDYVKSCWQKSLKSLKSTTLVANLNRKILMLASEIKFARENAETIFQIRIESEGLYEDEEMSKEFIESIVNDETYANKIKDIMFQNILKDLKENPKKFHRDENNKLIYDYTMMDYGYAIEEYCEKEYDKSVDVFIHVCKVCGGMNVEVKVWKNPNTGEVGEPISSENEDTWCNDCEAHNGINNKIVKKCNIPK
jgi:hypothetical protein